MNQELDGFVNDALGSDSSILVADLNVMSRGDINVILSELAAKGVKATVYIANAGDANQASFIMPASAQIKLNVDSRDVASVRNIALTAANLEIGTSVGITGMQKISGNVQMQRTVAAHLVGQFVIMTDDQTALMGVARTLDVNSYLTEIANAIRSEARIKQSA
jgi:hypothetical protein